MGGDKLYFHVFTFRGSLLVEPTNVWSVKPSPWKCGAGYGVRLADLFQEKGREIVRTGNPDAGGKAGQQPLLATALTEGEDSGSRRYGRRGKGARGLALPEAPGNHLPSSHLVAMMPKAKTTAAKIPIMAA